MTIRRSEILGIGCRFPGSSSPAAFWQSLSDGVDQIREVPADRWQVDSHYSDRGAPGKSRTRWGGFVDAIDEFDAEFFGISPREAELLDPQQRLLLEVVHQALEDAGVPLRDLADRHVGVFVGGFTLDYMLLQLGGESLRQVEPHTATGSMMTLLANRISYVFGFDGPSITVDTACSSSLTATHLAHQALLRGECDVAIVAGVNAMLGQAYTVAESRAGMLSPTGRSRAFDARADGYVRGEGAGAIVLALEDSAIAAGRRTYASLRATAINQDGRSDGLTVPSGAAQERLVRRALEQAEVDPREIAFVEAHGTGTPVGDPIEATALGSVLGRGRAAADRCWIGSVKTNIGHLEAAAGVAGLIKAALQLHHGTVAPHLHFRSQNPALDLDALGLAIPTDAAALRPDARFASVNSFGFGGSNAHVVLERAAAAPVGEPAVGPRPSALLAVSAHSAAAVDALSGSYADLLETLSVPLHDVAAAAVRSRDHAVERRTVVDVDGTGAARQLRAPHEPVPRSVTDGDLVFVFSGMGPQWAGMGRELYRDEPVFRRAVDAVSTIGDDLVAWSLRSAFDGTLSDSAMDETEVAQPANFALQVGVTELLRSWGVEPDLVVGHSAGEPAAAWAAGVLSLHEATRVSFARSTTQQRTTGRGGLIAVGGSVDDLRARLADAPGLDLEIAAVNSPTAATVVGSDEDVAALATLLEQDEVFHRVLDVRVPYHSRVMEEIEDELLGLLAGLVTAPARVPIVSTVTGAHQEGHDFDPEYWFRNVRQPVRFEDAVRTLLADGARQFVEIAPHPVLLRAVTETASASGTTVALTEVLRRDAPGAAGVLRAAGTVWEWGNELDWDAVLGNADGHVDLPFYPWQRRRFWHESARSAQRTAARPHPFLVRRSEVSTSLWEVDLEVPALAWLEDHRIEGVTVFPAAGYTDLALWAGAQAYGDPTGLVFRDLAFVSALYVGQDEHQEITLEFDERSGVFTVRSRRADDAPWVVHATGLLASTRPGSGGPLTVTPPQGSERLDEATAYAGLAALGLEYGPSFRVIRTVHRGNGRALARIQLDAHRAAAAAPHVVHPTLIDAGFQVLALAAASLDGGTFMPVSVEEGRLFGELPTEVLVHATVRDGGAPGEIVGDVTFSDLHGAVLLTVRGCRARDVQAATAAPAVRHHVVDWIPAEAPVPADEVSGTSSLLIGPEEVTAPLRDLLHAAGVRTDALPTDVADAEVAASIGRGTVRSVVDLRPASSRRRPGPAGSISTALASMHLHRVCSEARGSRPPRVWTVTRGAQPVDGTVDDAAQAAVWGLVRVAGEFEMPAVRGGLVDVDELDERTLRALVTEVTGDRTEDQVAYRDGHRHVPRVREVTPSTRAMAPFRPDAAYLISGGLGGLGLATAGWFVDHGARHLVLVGRTALPPRDSWGDSDDPTVLAVTALEARGATVEVRVCDVADLEALRALDAERTREGRVPIRGVVHAAGTSVPRLIADMSDEDFRAVARAKIEGGHALDQVFATGLDLFVVYSSIASLVVSAGQADYAAGNAYLDALVHERRGRGEHGLSINWGPWGDVGMATRLDLVSFFLDRGLRTTSAAQGLSALERAIVSGSSQVVPVAPDWPRAIATYPLGDAPALLDELRGVEDVGGAESGSVGSLTESLAAADEEGRSLIVDDEVRRVVGTALRADHDAIARDVPLVSLGLDSMLAIEIKGRLEQSLSVNVPIVSLLKGGTLQDLSEDCSRQVGVSLTVDSEVQAVLDLAEGLDLSDVLEAQDDH